MDTAVRGVQVVGVGECRLREVLALVEQRTARWASLSCIHACWREGERETEKEIGDEERGGGSERESTPARPLCTCKRDSTYTLAQTHMLSESCE